MTIDFMRRKKKQRTFNQSEPEFLPKQWVREHARGSQRFGLVASSGGHRLKPHAIDIRVELDPGSPVPE